MSTDSNRTVIPVTEAARLATDFGGEAGKVLDSLLESAATFSRPPVSDFRVGAVARGATGTLYLGANVEFAGESLAFTIHAEQSAVANAWMHGETGIDLIATSASPCGFCRQFLNELVSAPSLRILTNGRSRPLAELLPDAFGPQDLDRPDGLLSPMDHRLEIVEGDALAQAALAAANISYAPYSGTFAGVALQTSDGAIIAGAYAENAAFNPSLAPLEAALSQLNLRGGAFGSIAEAVLVQVGTSHTAATRAVLTAVCDAPLRVIDARNSR